VYILIVYIPTEGCPGWVGLGGWFNARQEIRSQLYQYYTGAQRRLMVCLQLLSQAGGEGRNIVCRWTGSLHVYLQVILVACVMDFTCNELAVWYCDINLKTATSWMSITMSGLYQYFVTTVLLMGIAMFSTVLFYPRTQLDLSVDLQNDIDRTYILTLWSSGSLFLISGCNKML